jgi:hypothetical protein
MRIDMMRALRFMSLLGLIAGGALVLTAAPASAELTGCPTKVLDETSYRVYCQGSPPTAFRAVVICTDNTTRYGRWEFAGSSVHSTARCPTNQFVVQASIQFAGV